MLTAHHISKTYGIQPVLKDISFSIGNRDRIGLIGPNGCGKTTLMRILAGFDQPNFGRVILTRPDLRIGYLAQGMEFTEGQTIQAALHPEEARSEDPEVELAELAGRISDFPEDSSLLERYDTVLRKLARGNSESVSILGSLGLGDYPPDTPVARLSGGQKTRLMLARVLLHRPHLLLLDEPTNHLDIFLLEWLEEWINKFIGAALIVSHDRAFLDHTVNTIFELDPLSRTLQIFPGDFSDYVETRMTLREKQVHDYQDQQDELAQLRMAASHLRGLARMKKGGKADSGDKLAKGFFADRAKNTTGRAKHIEARIEQILSEHPIEKPRQSWQMKLDFGEQEHFSKNVLVTSDLDIGYEPGSPLLSGLNLHIRHGQRIALIGPNGSGKTTLIRTITGGLEPLGGEFRLGQSVKLGYIAQEQETLDPDLSALESVQKAASFNETEARHFLHFFLFSGDDPLRPTRELSFGERARLQLGLLVAGGCSFLILDEPINHLDIPSRSRFEQALSHFKGAVLAVVHDRYFIEQFASEIWTIRNGGVTKW